MYAQYENGRIVIYDSYLFRDSIKGIMGRIWHAESKTWSVPAIPLNQEVLKMLGCKFVGELITTQKCENPKITHAPKQHMPIKAKPYNHQVEGYNLACDAMGIFN